MNFHNAPVMFPFLSFVLLNALFLYRLLCFFSLFLSPSWSRIFFPPFNIRTHPIHIVWLWGLLMTSPTHVPFHTNVVCCGLGFAAVTLWLLGLEVVDFCGLCQTPEVGCGGGGEGVWWWQGRGKGEGVVGKEHFPRGPCQQPQEATGGTSMTLTLAKGR